MLKKLCFKFQLTSVRKSLIFKTTVFLILFLATLVIVQNNNLLAGEVFSPGQEDESVEELQNKLEELSFFSVSQTGLYGEETRRAVERFQAAADLRPDGIAGPETLNAIDRALNSIDVSQREQLKIYTHNVDVIYLQYKLSQLGYLATEPTGLFRSQTQSAVKEFQTDHGIDSDGIVGRSTWQALEEEFDQLGDATYDTDEIEEDIEDDTEEAVAEAEDQKETAEQTAEVNADEMEIIRSGDSGEAVAELQENLIAIGLYPLSADGDFGHQTEMAVRQFQEMSGLDVDGVVGPATWEELLTNEEGEEESSTYQVRSGDSLWTIANRFDASVNDIRAANNINGDAIRAGQSITIPGSGSSNINQQSIEALSWGQVNRLFPRNSTAKITDVQTGLSFRVRRLYGTNHADVEPLTAQDTNVMRRIYGGSWSWDRRAVVVNINGRLIAGSINGMPHGGQSINNNNFNGHFCVHFEGSRTHGNNRVDSEHQNMIQRAASQNWPLYRN